MAYDSVGPFLFPLFVGVFWLCVPPPDRTVTENFFLQTLRNLLAELVHFILNNNEPSGSLRPSTQCQKMTFLRMKPTLLIKLYF